MDMISRNDTNEVAIIGSKTSFDLTKINDQQDQAVGLTLRYDQDKYFMQSDHYPFAKRGIPVLFYNSRNHPDLHQPTDDVDKIIPEKMAKIGQLVFSTAWTVANQTKRPRFNYGVDVSK